MTKPNNFGNIYNEFLGDSSLAYRVYSKKTGQIYYEGFTDKLTLEGVRRTLRGLIYELTELNSKGKPYYRFKFRNTKANQSLLMIQEALKENELLYIKVMERF